MAYFNYLKGSKGEIFPFSVGRPRPPYGARALLLFCPSRNMQGCDSALTSHGATTIGRTRTRTVLRPMCENISRFGIPLSSLWGA